jgi:hypothetical protein
MFYLELQQVQTYHTRNHYKKGQNQRFTITLYMSHFVFLQIQTSRFVWDICLDHDCKD